MFHIAQYSKHLPRDRAVIKRHEVLAAFTADEIIHQAQADADAIRQAAKLEYQRQKQKGYADGLEEANVERTRWMSEAVAQTADYYTVVETRMVSVVQRAIENVLGQIDEHELLCQSVRQALSWARDQSRITLRVHPGHVERLRSKVDELKSLYPSVEILDIEPDAKLSGRQCFVETEIGSIDAGLDVQFDAVIAALRASLHDPHATTFTNGSKRAERRRDSATEDLS